MDKTYKVKYINWKDVEHEVYIVARNKSEARRYLRVMQGMKTLLKLEEWIDK